MQAAPNAAPSCAQTMFPFMLMIVIFYFLLIRPQQKQEKQRQDMLSKLAKGDLAITSGGLIGTIHTVKDQEILLEIADKVKVRIAREDIDLYQDPTTATNKDKSAK
jgi:preprotein translocase subunit YajC